MTDVFLLHGAGATPATLLPLEVSLRECGHTRIHRFRYPVSELPFEECLDALSEHMETLVSKTSPVILIGQSIGGVFANNLHRKGWTNIVLSIYIASPLSGARLLSQLKRIVPKCLWNYICRGRHVQYEYLMEKGPEDEPPHEYATISTSWPLLTIDGCVYQDETMLDPDYHHHIPWSTHWTLFSSPALARKVQDLIKDAENDKEIDVIVSGYVMA